MKTPTSEGAYPFLVTVRYQAGDLVTHDFGQFGPIFMMNFGDFANSEDGAGMLQGFPGPGEGAAGILVGSVTGNVVTVRGEEEIIRSFSIQFRSAQVMLGETPCGGN